MKTTLCGFFSLGLVTTFVSNAQEPPPAQEAGPEPQHAQDGTPEPQAAQDGAPKSSHQDTRTYEWQFRILDPKIRVYFEAESDESDHIDLFRDGSLAAAVELAGFVKPVHYTVKQWTINVNLGIGIGGAGTTSESGVSVASGAPMVLASAGLLLEVPLSGDKPRENYIGLEFGLAYGRTSDENFNGSSAEDKAWYIGVTMKVPPK